jgi:hypothetical protein
MIASDVQKIIQHLPGYIRLYCYARKINAALGQEHLLSNMFRLADRDRKDCFSALAHALNLHGR